MQIKNKSVCILDTRPWHSDDSLATPI